MRLAYALVLSAAPAANALCERVVAAARACLPADAVFEDRWLADGEAWEAEFTVEDAHGEALAIADRAIVALAAYPVDVNVVPSDIAHRRKRLLVADMESTIICEELLDEIADEADLGGRIAEITARAMRGELEFEAALAERVAMLKGLPLSLLDTIYRERVSLMPGAEKLLRTMKAHGAVTALVSGGFTIFTERIAQRLGFDTHQANTLGHDGGHLSGEVARPILGRSAKRAALERLATQRGLSPAMTLAVGDGANDLDMIAAAGLGVAFRAKPKVQEAARVLSNGAVINHGDLTALLYLQGYRRVDFA